MAEFDLIQNIGALAGVLVATGLAKYMLDKFFDQINKIEDRNREMMKDWVDVVNKNTGAFERNSAAFERLESKLDNLTRK